MFHIGASLKDLGKKLFAFSKLNLSVDVLLKEIGHWDCRSELKTENGELDVGGRRLAVSFVETRQRYLENKHTLTRLIFCGIRIFFETH